MLVLKFSDTMHFLVTIPGYSQWNVSQRVTALANTLVIAVGVYCGDANCLLRVSQASSFKPACIVKAIMTSLMYLCGGRFVV